MAADEMPPMSGIEFGATLPSLKGIAEFARSAEALGYDYLGCGEHMMFHGPIGNSLIGLSIAAGATTSIKLMSSVVLLPLYTPMVLAKLTSVLDVTSGGRYHMGIGIGGEFPKEFEACGIPLRQRASRANEALEVIRRLWTEPNVTFEGRYSRFAGITLSPRPLQEPHPPIWVAGRKEAAMVRAAKYGDGWLPYMYTPEMLHESVEKVRTLHENAGRASGGVRTGLFIFTSIGADRAAATRQAAHALGRNYAQDFSRIVEKYTLCGTPADCRKRLKEYVDAGAQTVLITWACEPEAVPQNLRSFAEEVAPEFRQSPRHG
jgi:probable F420-dependent oxidoreductase